MKRNLYQSIICIFIFASSSICLFAQDPPLPPEGIVYQAEARDDKGKLLTNKTLEVKLILTEEKEYQYGGTKVWEGDYSVNTDKYGLFSLIIGAGESSSFDFSDIHWGDYEHFLTVQLKIDGIWETTGSLQFLSVPYAMHAGTAQSAMSAEEVDWDDVNNIPAGFADNTDDVNDDDPDPTNEIQTLSLTNDNLTISGEGGNTVTFSNWDTDASNDVITTGDQIIEGNKTFSGRTYIERTPYQPTQAANKAYVDNAVSYRFSNYQVVKNRYEDVEIEPYLSFVGSATCPDGMMPLGGGGGFGAFSGQIAIYSSHALDDKWRVFWTNTGNTKAKGSLWVQVICAKVSPY